MGFWDSSQCRRDGSHIQLPAKVGSLIGNMRNVHEVLAKKELELATAVKNVEALRIAAYLLCDGDDGIAESSPWRTPLQEPLVHSEAVTDSPPSSSSRWREVTKLFLGGPVHLDTFLGTLRRRVLDYGTRT